MAYLVFLRGPKQVRLKKDRKLKLKPGAPILVGTSANAALALAGVRGIADQHARFEYHPDGKWYLQDLGSTAGTFVDDEPVEPHQVRALHDGPSIRFGDVVFRFFDEEQRVQIRAQPLFVWWNEAEEARSSFTRDELIDTARLCTTYSLQKGLLPVRRGLEWYKSYLQNKDRAQSALPLPLTLLIDLGAILAFNPPPLRGRRYLKYSGDSSLPSRFHQAYERQFIQSLAFRPEVRSIREQVARSRDPRQQGEAIALFVAMVSNWLATAWIEADVAAGHPREDADISAHAGKLRLLVEPIAVQEFLIQLGDISARAGSLESVIDPVRRFLLAARAEVPTAFEDYDGDLIEECLKSRELDEREYEEEPVDLAPLRPEIPSNHPGDELAIRRTKKTSELAKLPRVLPQEFFTLQLDETEAGRHASQPQVGKRYFLHQLIQEGLLCWEQQDYDTKILRQRYLVCLVADIGPETNVRGRPATLQGWEDEETPLAQTNTPNTHGRRLVFEILRDLAQFVDVPHTAFDIAVFLEPVKGDLGDRLAWNLTLDRLRHQFGKAAFHDMVELERCAPGYFFPGHQARARRENDYHRFLRSTFEADEYDFTLILFMGLGDHLRMMLPLDAPPPRNRPGVKDVVRLVQLSHWPYGVEMAKGASFDDVASPLDFEFFSDEELRVEVLSDLLGTPRNRPELDHAFNLEGMP